MLQYRTGERKKGGREEREEKEERKRVEGMEEGERREGRRHSFISVSGVLFIFYFGQT